MEDDVVVVPSLSEGGEILASFRSMFIVQLDRNGALESINMEFSKPSCEDANSYHGCFEDNVSCHDESSISCSLKDQGKDEALDQRNATPGAR